MVLAGMTMAMMCMVRLNIEPAVLPEPVQVVKEAAETKPKKKKKKQDDENEYLGEFLLTAYCPCNECSDGYGRHTSTGATARSEWTVAVDPSVIPYGTHLIINGEEYVAQDCGGGVKGNHIDIFFDTHSETLEFGKKYAKVYKKGA